MPILHEEFPHFSVSLVSLSDPACGGMGLPERLETRDERLRTKDERRETRGQCQMTDDQWGGDVPKFISCWNPDHLLH